MIRAEQRQREKLEAAQAPRGLAQHLSPLSFLISCTLGLSRSSSPACAFQPLGLGSPCVLSLEWSHPSHDFLTSPRPKSFSFWVSQEWRGQLFFSGCPSHKSVVTGFNSFSLQDCSYELLLGNLASGSCFYPESILINYELKNDQVQDKELSNIQVFARLPSPKLPLTLSSLHHTFMTPSCYGQLISQSPLRPCRVQTAS